MEQCNICFDLPLNKDDVLSCGHRVHISCVQKQFKPECPFCRASLNIKVYGNRPCVDENLFAPQNQEEKKIRAVIVHVYNPNVRMYESDDYEENDCENVDDDSRYQLYSQEESEDEENPHGDCWDYEDV